jgi:RimJ/RimL family protein N-acetyltransferase
VSSEALQDALAKNSEFVGSVAETFPLAKQQRANQMRFRMSSIYIGPDGNVYLLRPHTHNETSKRALIDLGFTPDLRAKGNFQDLVPAGMMRAQYYDDGVGFSIDVDHPPTPSQLQSVKEAWELSGRGFFIAELYSGGKVVGDVRSFDYLVYLLDHFDPTELESGKAPTQIREFLASINLSRLRS